MMDKKKDIEICKTNIIHKEIIKKVINKIPEDEILYELADFFKVFGDTTRIKILNLLFNHEMCVCDISYTLKISQSAISHQLRILRKSKLVKYRKEGKVVYYSLDDEHVSKIYNMALEHIMED